MRYAIKSDEELWVESCSKFFEVYGDEWRKVPSWMAAAFILQNMNGQGNPFRVRTRVEDLYRSIGVKDI